MEIKDIRFRVENIEEAREALAWLEVRWPGLRWESDDKPGDYHPSGYPATLYCWQGKLVCSVFDQEGTKTFKQFKEICEMEEKWEYGDILVNAEGNRRKILGVCGEMVFVSFDADHKANAITKSRHTLESRGWRKETEKPRVKMTLADIEAALKLEPGTLEVV